MLDGTGAPGRRADMGIHDGRIVAVGEVEDTGATELDADGLMVAPGIIDPHTHYDAQLFWDPLGLTVQRARRDDGHRRATEGSRWPRSTPQTPTTSAR